MGAYSPLLGAYDPLLMSGYQFQKSNFGPFVKLILKKSNQIGFQVRFDRMKEETKSNSKLFLNLYLKMGLKNGSGLKLDKKTSDFNVKLFF